MARGGRSTGAEWLPKETSGSAPWPLLAALLLCTGTAAAWLTSQPLEYRAACVVQYEQEPSSTGSVAAVSSVVGGLEWYRTQDFLIASNSVAEAVVARLRLENDRGFVSQRAGESVVQVRAKAAARLRESLSVERVPETRLVRITIVDTDSKRAAELANVVAETYLAASREGREMSHQRAVAWLAAQVDGTAERLQRTEAEMQRFFEQRKASELPLAEHRELLAAELKQLSQVLTETRVRKIELAAKVAKLKAAQRDNPFEVHTSEVDANEQAKQLAAEYQAALLRHRALNVTQGANAPTAQLESSRLQGLSEQMRAVVVGIAQSSQAELAAVQSVEAQLQASLLIASDTVKGLQQQELQYGRLNRERDDAAALLKALQERAAAINLANSVGLAGGRIVETARPPATHSTPWMRPLVCLGLSLAVLVPVGFFTLRRRHRRSTNQRHS